MTRCSDRATAYPSTPSLPGLTRQSIDLRKKFFARKMDARVKPAHDGFVLLALTNLIRAKQRRALPVNNRRKQGPDPGSPRRVPSPARMLSRGSSPNRFLITYSPFQTAYLVPAAHFLRTGFCLFASLTPSRGGRSAERRSGVLTPLPAPPSGSSPETPLNERGCESSTPDALRSQVINSICRRNFCPLNGRRSAPRSLRKSRPSFRGPFQ